MIYPENTFLHGRKFREVDLIDFPVYKFTTAENKCQNIIWIPGSAHKSKDVFADKFLSPNVALNYFSNKTSLIGYTHPILGNILNNLIQSDGKTYTNLLKGIAKVKKVFFNQVVLCEEIKIQKKIPIPKINNDSYLAIGFGLVYKIHKNKEILNLILDWHAKKLSISDLKVFSEKLKSKCQEKYGMVSHLLHAMVNYKQCDINKDNSNTWIEYWIAKVIWSTCEYAEKNKIDLDVIDVIETIFSKKIHIC